MHKALGSIPVITKKATTKKKKRKKERPYFAPSLATC
jgi:hypothetical protein